jgi:hypothetical protein
MEEVLGSKFLYVFRVIKHTDSEDWNNPGFIPRINNVIVEWIVIS